MSWTTPAGDSRMAGADVVGLNSSRGPQTLLTLIDPIRAAVACPAPRCPCPIGRRQSSRGSSRCVPQTGTRSFPLALDPFRCTRFETPEFATSARDGGVSHIRIYCGAGPHHVRAMAEALGRTVPASRYSPALSLHSILGKDVN